MARPSGDAYGVREPTIDDVREAFISRAHAKNLAPRTIEWYERHTMAFGQWCASVGITLAAELRSTHLDDYLVFLHGSGLAPHTVAGAAQVAKSATRFGFRKGFIVTEISRDFELPKVPEMIIATFSDEQLRALFGAIDQRRWTGIRDRAILILLLDTLARVSELTGLNLEDVDLDARSLRAYMRAVQGHCEGDPFIISRTGRRLTREGIAAAMRTYARKAKIQGVRSSPHTLRHTGAKRFILSGGDVFTLQKLLGHRSLAMVRRYVELAAGDVRVQHQRYSPADTLLRRPHPS